MNHDYFVGVPWIPSRKAGGIALRFPEDRMSLGALTNPSIEVRREAETGLKLVWCLHANNPNQVHKQRGEYIFKR